MVFVLVYGSSNVGCDFGIITMDAWACGGGGRGVSLFWLLPGSTLSSMKTICQASSSSISAIPHTPSVCLITPTLGGGVCLSYVDSPWSPQLVAYKSLRRVSEPSFLSCNSSLLLASSLHLTQVSAALPSSSFPAFDFLLWSESFSGSGWTCPWTLPVSCQLPWEPSLGLPWDGWMASLTRWMWVWVNSGSWWWTGRPGVLWFMESQSWTWLSDWTELNWEAQSRLNTYAGQKSSWILVLALTSSSCIILDKWPPFYFLILTVIVINNINNHWVLFKARF